MTLICEYCGKSYQVYDNYRRKYCPECQHSWKRINVHFQTRKKNDEVLRIHVSHYEKRHFLYKSGKITKDALDEWRLQSGSKQREISVGKITIEEYRTWCEETYKAGHSNVRQSRKKSINSKKTDYEYIYPLTVPPYLFVGNKPIALLFGDECVEVKNWREVYTVIIKRCNKDPKFHEKLMYMRNIAAGKVRVFISDKPDGMTRPIEIDTDMYCEVHYGSETLMHILVNQILKPVGFDCVGIRVALKTAKDHKEG